MRQFYALLLFGLAAAAPSPAKQLQQSSAQELFVFDNATILENLSVQPDGRLLLSSVTSPNLYRLDPAQPGKVNVITTIPGVGSLLASAFTAPDLLAIHVGTVDVATFAFVNGTGAIWLVDLGESPARARQVAAIPYTKALNGMAVLPQHPHVVLSLDSFGGRVFRTDTNTGAVDVAFQSLLFGPANNSDVVPVGANGIQIRDNTLFFTNSGQGFFGKVPISDMGDMVGPVIKLHEIHPNETYAYDDFDIDRHGNAYVALHPDLLVKITPDGQQTVVVGGPGDSSALENPTSARLSGNQKTIYVTTVGANEVVNGTFRGGQVVAVQIE